MRHANKGGDVLRGPAGCGGGLCLTPGLVGDGREGGDRDVRPRGPASYNPTLRPRGDLSPPTGSSDPSPSTDAKSPPTGSSDPQAQASKRRRRKKKSPGPGSDATQSLSDRTSSEAARREHLMHTVQLMGHSAAVVESAAHRIEDCQEDLTYDSLIDMAFIVQQEAPLPSEVTAVSHLAEGEKEQPADGGEEQPESDIEEEEDNESQETFQEKLKTAIERKKMELRSAIEAMTFQCRVCNCSRATILLLPCGHLASCDDCLMDVRRCPINRCNKVVRGTKEVYFV